MDVDNAITDGIKRNLMNGEYEYSEFRITVKNSKTLEIKRIDT